MVKTFEPTPNPVMRIPTSDEAMRMGRVRWLEFMNEREEIIRKEKEDPYRHGWEPESWGICDALLDWKWMDHDATAKTREALGFDKPIDVLLIMGGNRSSKSEYAAKRCQRVMNHEPERRIWTFHSSNQNSVDYQQPLIWKYMPQEFKIKLRTEIGYISYNQKYGFSDNKFVLPNASEASHRNYEQDITKIEGGDIDLAWADELVPPDWVDPSLLLRIATRAGKILVTFTPVRGYTGTVKQFLDGAQVVQESTAFLCPRDEGPPLEDLALARETCHNWAEGKPSQPAVPPGRSFQKVPRVMKCAEDKKAVVYFHSSDNPYGNPASVAEKIRGKSMVYIKERWYGIANKTIASRFPRFSHRIHCLPFKSIPTKGTNYQIVDPAGGRNFFMNWMRFTPDHAYVIREWPGDYEIPLHGVLGPWALADGKKHDGRPGPAQETLGFGLNQYKKEIARLEGWEDYKKAQVDGESKFPIEDWDERNGAEEVIEARYMDSRFASAPKLQNDAPVTLISKFEDIGLSYLDTPGDDISEGVQMVNDWLDYVEDDNLGIVTVPYLLFAENVGNTLFAVQTWTGADGAKGACKDPVDLLRYASLADLQNVDIEAAQAESRRGGHY